jgi:dUTP pyrophosphatase
MGRLLVHKLHPDAITPTIVHKGEDLGYDIYAVEDVFVEQGRQAVVPTGITAVYKPGITNGCVDHSGSYGLEIKDRSGLAAKHGFHTLAGVVDAGYRGMIKVIVVQLGEPVHIHPEDRVRLQGRTQPSGFPNERLDALSPAQLGSLAGMYDLRLGYQIKKGDKIAQMLPRLVLTGDIEVVDTLPDGARGARGFGSSGD